MTADFAIEAQNVVKFFGNKRALDGASVRFESGRVHVLLGRNGSGKTTLAKVLAGIINPNSGQVKLNGSFAAFKGLQFRKNVGLLFDSSAHWESLTGWENAWFFARSFGIRPDSATSRLYELFERMALTEVAHDQVSTYSYGMKRKLSIVQALVHEPKLLVMDEPSIGLDHSSRAFLYEIVRTRAAEGCSVVIATNDVNEARYVADVVSLVDKGRVIVTGAPDALVKELDQEVIVLVELVVPIQLSEIALLPGVVSVSLDDNGDSPVLKVMASSGDEQRVVTTLMNHLAQRNVKVARVDLRRPGLGEVFMKYMEDRHDAAG